MKAYVSTYCTWESFGSVLQSFGLKCALQELGVDSEILVKDPPPVFFSKPLLSGGLRRVPARMYDRLIQSKRKVSFQRGNAFIQEHLDVCYAPESSEAFAGRSCADLYVAGSDQIWNPEICDPIFFLDYVPEGKRKISYAASMGKTQIPQEKRERIARSLERFDRISVRETACRTALQELVETDISVNIDPVFFLSTEQWRAVEKPYEIDFPYILLYTIYWNTDLNQEVRALHQRSGLPVLVLSGHRNRCYGNRRIYDAGPAEFLWLIDHAEYVITSSFHAVAMSTIFQKRFAAVLNPAAPSRIQNLCERLGIPISDIASVYAACPIYNADDLRKRIQNARDEGMKYLEEAIVKA